MELLTEIATLAGLSLLTLLAVATAMTAFGYRPPPPPLAAVNGAFEGVDGSRLPPLERYPARDGASLAYRGYRATGRRTAILIHGSSGSAAAMHSVGLALAAAGISAYALDVRGHGASGRRGDIDYVDQLEDDLADFVAFIRPQQPDHRLFLVGHSSGGGFALRVAAGELGPVFERTVLLAPFLHQRAPTARPESGGWARPSIARIAGLSILGAFGIRCFEHLPVLAFAVPPGAPERTPTYSFRLQRGFRPHEAWREDVRSVRRPLTVIVGDRDAVFVPEAYAPALAGLSPRVAVRVLAGIDHTGVVVAPTALGALLDELA